jgi:DNA-directed RNA polymerase subunit RPC12/RpoP
VDLSKELGKGETTKESVNKEILTKYKRVKCSYCSSMFLMGKKPNCPNCGGVFEG